MKFKCFKVGIILIITLFPTLIFAYNLNGSMNDEGGGQYSVSLQNDNGHEYDGTATDNGDGTLNVNVEDDNGENYSGVAQDNGDGSYDLDLQNDSTGSEAGGTADVTG